MIHRLQNATLIEDTLEVEFPQSAILQLRSDKKIKRKLKLVIKTPGGNVSYKVPVVDVQEYDLDTIFEKGLYFLLPFYIFRYEKKFSSISKASDKKEVSSVMGGNVLQTEAHTILEQGETLGKLRGAAQNLVSNVESLMETMNWSLENACKALKTSVQEYNYSKALIK